MWPVEWRRIYVRADKPVLVVAQDRWGHGVSPFTSADNPGRLGCLYYAYSGNGRHLYVCSPSGAQVTVKWGSSTKKLSLNHRGWATVDFGGEAAIFSVRASTPRRGLLHGSMVGGPHNGSRGVSWLTQQVTRFLAPS